MPIRTFQLVGAAALGAVSEIRNLGWGKHGFYHNVAVRLELVALLFVHRSILH